ncbi:MAG: radical SAM/Cys-rich domain protein [Deltaproteobacteria bacterium]|nr:radical SAM/Cys-rich domain protein [Deltaproteobacteria bacterium]
MFSTVTPFAQHIRQQGNPLHRLAIDTVQVNVGKLCNQACLHCHVEAGPKRTEIMDRQTAEQVLDFIRTATPQTVDITGGAPELNPSFRWLVEQNRRQGRHVIDRCNLTILFEPGQEDLPQFLADQQVEIVASLPCYSLENVTKQRGQGVFEKSIDALKRLNRIGYGSEGSGLTLNLVYNPVGAHLPPPQAKLEEDYKRELGSNFGIAFNHLYTITNMPISRFAHALQREGKAEAYMELLAHSFNPTTLDGLMCRRQVSISWDGYLYDCDFNQMLDMKVGNGRPFRLGEKPATELMQALQKRAILVDSHCYGCTAGAGSSCGGSLQS